MESIVVNRIRELMEKESLTANSFANKVGITANSVYNLLEGGQPRMSTIKKISEAFPTYSTDWLLGKEGKIVEINSDNPYRDFLVKKLEQENKRLWLLVEKLSGAQVGSVNFNDASTQAGASGKVVQMNPTYSKPGAQVGVRA